MLKLKKDLLIPAGAILNNMPVVTDRYDQNGKINPIIDESELLTIKIDVSYLDISEWFEEV